MLDRLIEIASINSGTSNQPGVSRVMAVVAGWLRELTSDVQPSPLPAVAFVDDDGVIAYQTMADAVVARCRPSAPHQVLLSIHLDTVYGLDHPFQIVSRVEPNVLHGPGVADAKGGLVVMLAALAAFEAWQSPMRDRVGWTVVLNPDEETGSIASVGLLSELAKTADFGMVYEPTLPDGNLICQRKGSGNFTVVVRGRAAHAGRDFASGRNAIAVLCRLFVELETLTTDDHGITVNLGRIRGGGPLNIVADLAIGGFNVRAADDLQCNRVMQKIHDCIEVAGSQEGIVVRLHGGMTSPPKAFDAPTRRLFQRVVEAGEVIGLTLRGASSGGVCDGNKLAAAGLPNMDTLGPRGRFIHSEREIVMIDSLEERAKLSFELLLAFASDPEKFPSRFTSFSS